MISLPPLYAIINLEDHEDPIHFAQTLCTAGVSLIQLRAKTLEPELFTDISQAVLNAVSQYQTKIIINDSIAVCAAIGAHGVHLGQSDSSVETARRQLGPDAIIGLSNHNKQQLLHAPIETLSYLAIGPIFQSATKQGHAPVIGITELRQLITVAQGLPIVAIGGITAANCAAVFEAGATSVAVISDLAESNNLQASVDAFYAAAGVKQSTTSDRTASSR